MERAAHPGADEEALEVRAPSLRGSCPAFCFFSEAGSLSQEFKMFVLILIPEYGPIWLDSFRARRPC
jgi:hypothetical protein